jgi:hypothetical protein
LFQNTFKLFGFPSVSLWAYTWWTLFHECVVHISVTLP